jgi:hypothetical protein
LPNPDRATPLVTIPARGRDDGTGRLGRAAGLLLLLAALSACQSVGVAHAPGTPEYAAALVSRGYDCGLRPNRAGIARPFSGEDRRRFVRAGQELSVKAYNAPRGCGVVERAAISHELRTIGARR